MINIRNRSASLKDEKRRRLFEAAIAEFNEYGRENASFNRIIERSGVSKGTVYYYFDNKDALLTLVFDEIGRVLLEAVPDLPMPDTPKSFWETMWAYREREFDFFADNPELGQILMLPRRVNILELCDKDPDGCLARVVKRHVELIERGQELGAIRSDLESRTVVDIFGAVSEATCRFIFGEDVCALVAIMDADKRKLMKKYDVLSRDITYRVLLPIDKMAAYIKDMTPGTGA